MHLATSERIDVHKGGAEDVWIDASRFGGCYLYGRALKLHS